MNKSWILENKEPQQFQDGFNQFLEFCQTNCSDPERIHCPCIDCGNGTKGNITMIKNHVFCRGFDTSYRTWYWHGESLKNNNPYPFGRRGVDDLGYSDFDDHPMELLDEAQEEFVDDPSKFEKLVRDADKTLFNGCLK